MADMVRRYGVRLRPHAKTHKSPIIAQKQMVLGAVGVCCQTVTEAEAMVHGGIRDILLSNQVVDPGKISRLAALAREAKIGVCVDDSTNMEALAEAARAFGVVLDVLVEIEVGMQRCGVPPGDAAVALAKQVDAALGLRFAGLQAYHGGAQQIRDFDKRRAAITEAVALTRHTIELLKANGLETKTVAGAGTGTFPFEAASGIYNELQAGSYVFMDADYAKNRGEGGRRFTDFEHSLFVLATVISAPVGRAVLDAGLKSHSVDSGSPTVYQMEDVTYCDSSDEHGVLNLRNSRERLKIGEKVRLIPGHCDPTVNLHDWFVCIRTGHVMALWPIA